MSVLGRSSLDCAEHFYIVPYHRPIDYGLNEKIGIKIDQIQIQTTLKAFQCRIGALPGTIGEETTQRTTTETSLQTGKEPARVTFAPSFLTPPIKPSTTQNATEMSQVY